MTAEKITTKEPKPEVVKERPIPFSAPMVRAILAGTKTVTRRIVKPQPPAECETPQVGVYHPVRVDRHREQYPGPETFGASTDDWDAPCPFGRVGDRLWVRERCIQIGHERTTRSGRYRWPQLDVEQGPRWFDSCCVYAADLGYNDPILIEPHGTLHPLYMPRWASRITLEITAVRVERLQDITPEDAIAEGISANPKDFSAAIDGKPVDVAFVNPVYAFSIAWNALHGRGAWERNDWVWRIAFRRIEQGGHRE